MSEWLLYFHILGAAAWIGGGFFAVFTYSRLAGLGPEGGGRPLRAISQAADRYFGPAAVVTLLTGIGLVLVSEEWGWGDTFVLVGIGAFVVSGIWQPLVASKAEERFLSAVEEDDPNLESSLKSLRRVSVVDVGILLVALWAMVVRIGA